MSAQQELIVVQRQHVLVLTLNRPEWLNALNGTLQQQLEDVFTGAGQDNSVRALVITGSGRAFCAGADIDNLARGAQGSSDPAEVHVPSFTARQARVFKPTICAVNGICAGAGLHFVSDSDIVIASKLASFVDTHVDVGQVTALEPIGLMQRMPLSAVLRMVVLGRKEKLSAEQARAVHMVSEVVEPEALLGRALELAEIAASVSPAAVQRSIRAIWEALDRPLNQAMANGFDILIRHRSHPDALEGPTAFAQKRAAVWNDDPNL